MKQAQNPPPIHAGSGATPIHEQIYLRFRSMIEQGQLRPGQKVSSLRALATELGVARGTVQVAYDRLLGEGYLVARGPAGTFVTEHTAPAKPVRAKRSSVAARVLPDADAPDTVIELEGGSPVPLQMGLPALDEFPRKLWARLMARQVRKAGSLNRPAPAGHMPLREALAAYLHRSRGIDAHADQVFIMPAYTASLSLAVDALELARASAWVEHPGYPQTTQTLTRMGMQTCDVRVDEHGIDVEFGRSHFPNARLAVVTPSHQSPTGVALPLQRRVELLDWAVQHDAWIVEDDYDGEYRYRGHPLPALKSMDSYGRVIYCGTLSKVLFPGLRLSYVVVAQSLVPQFELACRRSVHGGCPELMQAVVADFISEGHFSRHIKRMRTLYARRRALLAEALAPYSAEGFVVHLQDGGMHLLVDVREDLDDVVLASRARKAGFAVHALTAWRNGSPGRRGLLLGFTNIRNRDEAEQQVAALIRAFDPRAD